MTDLHVFALQAYRYAAAHQTDGRQYWSAMAWGFAALGREYVARGHVNVAIGYGVVLGRCLERAKTGASP